MLINELAHTSVEYVAQLCLVWIYVYSIRNDLSVFSANIHVLFSWPYLLHSIEEAR